MTADLDLAERARTGDDDAFRQLVERHARRVFQTANRILGDEAAAEDVVQETFLRAHRALPRFDGRAQFATWLHRITVNQAIEVLRQRRRRGEVGVSSEASGDEASGAEPASPAPGPEQRAAASQIGSATQRAIADLTPMERVAFALRHFEGRSIDEISEALGTRREASKQAVFRAVKKLRRSLAPFVEVGYEAHS